MTSVSSDVHFGNAPCAPTAAVGACFYTSLAVTSLDRKSTRLNSSHSSISYAVFCLKKKNNSKKQPKQARFSGYSPNLHIRQTNCLPGPVRSRLYSPSGRLSDRPVDYSHLGIARRRA